MYPTRAATRFQAASLPPGIRAILARAWSRPYPSTGQIPAPPTSISSALASVRTLIQQAEAVLARGASFSDRGAIAQQLRGLADSPNLQAFGDAVRELRAAAERVFATVPFAEQLGLMPAAPSLPATGQISKIRRVETAAPRPAAPRPAAAPRATCRGAYCRVLSPDLRRVVFIQPGTSFTVAVTDPDGRYIPADPRDPDRGSLGWATFDDGSVGWVVPDEVSLLEPGTGQISAIRRVPTSSRFDAPYSQIAAAPPAAIIEREPPPTSPASFPPLPLPPPPRPSCNLSVRELPVLFYAVVNAVPGAAGMNLRCRPSPTGPIPMVVPAGTPLQVLETGIAEESGACPLCEWWIVIPYDGPPGYMRAIGPTGEPNLVRTAPPAGAPLVDPPPLGPSAGPPPVGPPRAGQVFAARLPAPRHAPTVFTARIEAYDAFDRAWEEGLPPKTMRALWRAVRMRAMELYGKHSDPGDRSDWHVYDRWWNETHLPTSPSGLRYVPTAPSGLRRVSTGQLRRIEPSPPVQGALEPSPDVAEWRPASLLVNLRHALATRQSDKTIRALYSEYARAAAAIGARWAPIERLYAEAGRPLPAEQELDENLFTAQNLAAPRGGPGAQAIVRSPRGALTAPMHATMNIQSGPVSQIPVGHTVEVFETRPGLFGPLTRASYNSPDGTVHSGWMDDASLQRLQLV